MIGKILMSIVVILMVIGIVVGFAGALLDSENAMSIAMVLCAVAFFLFFFVIVVCVAITMLVDIWT